jgi:hypothetical protein
LLRSKGPEVIKGLPVGVGVGVGIGGDGHGDEGGAGLAEGAGEGPNVVRRKPLWPGELRNNGGCTRRLAYASSEAAEVAGFRCFDF